VTADADAAPLHPGVPGARCDSCGHFWHPRPRHCALCLGDAFTDGVVAGDGVVYSVTVVRSGRNDRPLPYGLAHVDMDAGLRVMAGFDVVEGHDPKPGTRVAVGEVGQSEVGLPLLKLSPVQTPARAAGASA
jgi:uncharacterized OB-fold protein